MYAIFVWASTLVSGLYLGFWFISAVIHGSHISKIYPLSRLNVEILIWEKAIIVIFALVPFGLMCLGTSETVMIGWMALLGVQFLVMHIQSLHDKADAADEPIGSDPVAAPKDKDD